MLQVSYADDTRALQNPGAVQTVWCARDRRARDHDHRQRRAHDVVLPGVSGRVANYPR